MRIPLKTLFAASALVAGMAAAPALYAHGTEDTPGTQVPPMSQGNMMGQGNMMDQGNMEGRGDMMGMMKMMGQMMETHSKMMQTMIDAHGTAPSDNAPSDKE